MKNIILAFTVSAATLTKAYAAQKVEINPPPEGSVTVEQGLEAWSRIFEVTSHPRCSNCHAGPDNKPMWSGPSYGKSRPHGMNINAGESRIGAESIHCSTCHISLQHDNPSANAIPHTPPKVAGFWQMAPAEAHWFGKSSAEICAQLKNPELNGGREFIELANHLEHDSILHWAWKPGGNREPAPYSLQEHVNDILQWGVAGMPCPTS